jgi:hypothetical protein
MQFNKVRVSPATTRNVRRVESCANRLIRGADRVRGRLHLGGRKARYDDIRYEFLGGPADTLRTKHYDKSLRLLWKAEDQAPFLGFKDCTVVERQLHEMAFRGMNEEEKSQVARISSCDFRALLDREYTSREKRAVVGILSAIGHGEAYAWLVSAQLLTEVESTGARAALTMQVLEEAKHFLVLRELIRAFGTQIPRLTAPEYLMLEQVIKAKGTEKLFGMNVVVEGIALGLFGTMCHLPGLEVLRLFHLDESRHAGLPNNYFREFPLSESQRRSPLRRARRLSMVLPGLLLIPMLEADLAELGIDVFEFGGSVIRKIGLLAKRNNFDLPVNTDTLLALVNKLINAYGDMARPDHVRRDYVALEATRGIAELQVEREVLTGAAGLCSRAASPRPLGL